MPIYHFACAMCGLELEKLVKAGEEIDCPKCGPVFNDMGGYKMERLLSLPSPAQWNCRKP